jgi:hypothetical protein
VSCFIVDLLCGRRAQEGDMLSYDVLVELARVCLRQARQAKNTTVSAELRHLAKGYQLRAAAMDHGKLPDIGEKDAAA